MTDDGREAITPAGRVARIKHTGLEFVAWTDDRRYLSRGGKQRTALAAADRSAERRATP